MRTLLLFALAAFASVVALSPGAGARQTPASVAASTASERALVQGSREAVIKTGISADFFDRHFRLARVVDRPGDRRVVWLLSVGGYEATVNDSVGYYTEGARRVDTHSVAATLPQTSDITRTITRRRAEAAMRRCLGGPFSDPQVEYRAHGDDGRAALLLTASRTIPPPPESRAARARREREERAARARAQQGAPDPEESDPVRGKGTAPKPVLLLGAVDLATGECSVGYGRSGSVAPPLPRRPGRQR